VETAEAAEKKPKEFSAISACSALNVVICSPAPKPDPTK